MKRYRLIFTVLSFLFTLPAFGELRVCNGVWTEKSCEDTTGSQTSFSKAKKDPVLSEKESLLHELTMKQIEAQRKYGVEHKISAAEKQCLELAVSIKDCQKITKELADEIDDKIFKEKLLRAKSNEPEQKEDQNTGSNVVIINERTTNIAIEKNKVEITTQQSAPSSPTLQHRKTSKPKQKKPSSAAGVILSQ